MSLRIRVVASIVFVLLLGSVVGLGVAGWQAKRALREELAAALVGGRQTVASAFEDLPRSDHPARDLRQLVATFDGNRHLAALLVDAAGHTVFASRAASASPAPVWFHDLLGDTLPDAHIPAPAPGQGVIVLRLLYANDVGALWSEFVDLAGVLAVSLLLGSIAAWLTVGRALRPLAAFSDAFVRIGSGDYAARAPRNGPAELTRLARGVDDMARRLSAMHARNHALEEQLRTLQDEERADLARDLHDEIGPHLFAVNVDAATARRLIVEGDGRTAIDRLAAIQDAVGHMQALVRDILGRLRPTELIELGLQAAIGELVAFWRARRPEITFAVSVPPDETISRGRRETLYRVVQEGLNNAVRHARPGRIEIVVTSTPDGAASARITDDGLPAARTNSGGYGLIGMRERVSAAGGDLIISRGEAGGWTVLARLPAEQMGEADET
jgi:two-component system sensor histidine kinase UhpB